MESRRLHYTPKPPPPLQPLPPFLFPDFILKPRSASPCRANVMRPVAGQQYELAMCQYAGCFKTKVAESESTISTRKANLR